MPWICLVDSWIYASNQDVKFSRHSRYYNTRKARLAFYVSSLCWCSLPFQSVRRFKSVLMEGTRMQ